MLKLKDVRLKFNIRQKDVCDALNIPQNTYSQYENNKREPDNETLSRIADYFHVSTDYLLGRTDETTKPPPSLDKQHEGIDFAFYNEIKDLTDEEEEQILGFIRFIKSQRQK